MTAITSPPASDRVAARGRSSGFFLISGIWLAISIAGTVLGVVERWPSQFNGAGSVATIGTQWMTKGTVMSPPLFLMVALAVAVVVFSLVHNRGVRAGAALLACLVGIAAVVGSLGEVLAAPVPDVPRAAQISGLIGVALSLALAIIAGLVVVRMLRSAPSAGASSGSGAIDGARADR